MAIDWRKARTKKPISQEFYDELYQDLKQTTGNLVTAIIQPNKQILVSGRYIKRYKGKDTVQEAKGVLWNIQDLALYEHRTMKLRARIARLSDYTGKSYEAPQYGQIEHKSNPQTGILGLESQYKRYNAMFKVAKKTTYHKDGTIISVEGYSRAQLLKRTYNTKVDAIIASMPDNKLKEAAKKLGLPSNINKLSTKQKSKIIDAVGLSFNTYYDPNADLDEDEDDPSRTLSFLKWQYRYIEPDDLHRINSGLGENNKEAVNDYINMAKQYQKYVKQSTKEAPINKYSKEVRDRVMSHLDKYKNDEGED